MDRYQKVEKPKPELPLNENEMRITSSGPIRNYISYATSLLQGKQAKEVVLKAMGQAISKSITIAEILKRRIPGLHQDTAISSVSVTDVWEPIEEGLVPVEMTRQISMISITLSINDLNKNSPGYQVPQHAEQQKTQYRYQQQEHQVRRPRNAYNEDSYGQDVYARGSNGRGRGRGGGRGRGWSRGGYNNYQDDGGYSNWGQGGDRDYQGGYGNYQDGGYERGSGGGGRGYGGGRGRGRSRGGGRY